MAAAVSVGSAAQALGASALHAAQAVPAMVPQVVGGGAQVVTAGAQGTAQLASNLALVEKPIKAVAAGVQRSSLLLGTANFLSKALPIVTIGAGAFAGASIVQSQGADALITSKQGRGAVLGTVGGVLLLVPTPATQLAAAGVLGAVAANQFDAFERLDRPAKPA
ncbi:MAG: hypothetical protein JWM90_2480 [Thermoleophilia bacterium]|nr:hypothetical protein [Thermoleophilia bacterium]